MLGSAGSSWERLAELLVLLEEGGGDDQPASAPSGLKAELLRRRGLPTPPGWPAWCARLEMTDMAEFIMGKGGESETGVCDLLLDWLFGEQLAVLMVPAVVEEVVLVVLVLPLLVLRRLRLEGALRPPSLVLFPLPERPSLGFLCLSRWRSLTLYSNVEWGTPK